MRVLAVFIQALFYVFDFIQWLVLIWVIVSWGLFFAAQTSFAWRYRNAYRILNQLNDIFTRMTYPLLKPFRRLLPPHKTAGIDWSPMLLLLAIFIVRQLLVILISAA